jgi:uncharacterized phiE125 gp8 family phage protein
VAYPYRDPPRAWFRPVSPPEEEPIDLETAMNHLGITLDDRTQDAKINRSIAAARAYCENYLGRKLAPQTVEMAFGGMSQPTTAPTYWQPLALNPWPDSGNVIELPFGPVSSVESVKYYDAAGDLQTMDSADYVLADDTISLASGASWPTVAERRNAIQVRYIAGFTHPDDSPSPYPLPPDLHAAMLLMLGHYYENREAVVVSSATATEVPMAARNIMDLSGYRLRRGMA